MGWSWWLGDGAGGYGMERVRCELGRGEPPPAAPLHLPGAAGAGFREFSEALPRPRAAAACPPVGELVGECQSPAYLLSGTIEGSALLFYLARPAGKPVPWGRGCTGAASGAARRGGVLLAQTRTRTRPWTSPSPRARQVNSPVAEGVFLLSFLPVLRALGKGCPELEGWREGGPRGTQP